MGRDNCIIYVCGNMMCNSGVSAYCNQRPVMLLVAAGVLHDLCIDRDQVATIDHLALSKVISVRTMELDAALLKGKCNSQTSYGYEAWRNE